MYHFSACLSCPGTQLDSPALVGVDFLVCFSFSFLFMCVCVCVKNENESARRMASTTSENRKHNEKKSTEQEEAHFFSRVTVILTREKERDYLLNRDRSRLLWMTVGPKGQYSAKRRTCKRQSSKTFKRWSNLHRRRPLAVLRTSGVIVHLALGAPHRALGYVLSNFWHTHTLGTRTAETKRKRKKKKSKLKERRKKK